MMTTRRSGLKNLDDSEPLPPSLYFYLWRIDRRCQITLVLLAVLAFPLTMVPLELQRRIIDDAVMTQNLDLLWLLGGIYGVYMLVNGGLKFCINLLRGWVVQRAAADLRRRIERSVRDKGAEQMDEGAVVSMLAAEAERVGQFVGGAFSTPLMQGGSMLALLGYMLWIEPVIALIGAMVYLPQIILTPLLQQRINRHNEAYAREVREMGEIAVEGEAADGAAFHETVARSVRSKMRVLRIKFVLKLARNLFTQLGPLSILMVGGLFVIEGRMEVGAIVAFLSGFERLTKPWNELIAFYRQVSNARMKYAMVLEAFPESSKADAGGR